MNHIRKNTTILETLTGGEFRQEYRIGAGVHADIVVLVHAAGPVTVVPGVHLAGAGASASVTGIVYGEKDAAVRIETLQHHMAPDTTSNLLVKSVMTDRGSVRYEGSIVVDAPAQKTDAYQRDENLLLTQDARAVSKPALEILANDVRCTHGAIVKTLDADELWYMAARGIAPVKAQEMITEGFLRSAADSVSDPILRDTVQNLLDGILYKRKVV